MTTLLKALINETAPVPMATVMYQSQGRGNKNINNYKLNMQMMFCAAAEGELWII